MDVSQRGLPVSPVRDITRTILILRRQRVILDAELATSNAALARKLDELERKYDHHDEAITAILSAIRELTNPNDLLPALRENRGISYRPEPVPPGTSMSQ